MASKTKETSLDVRKYITELHKEGKYFREIGKILKLSFTIIGYIVKKYLETGSVENKPRPGGPSKLISRAKRMIVSVCSDNQHTVSLKARTPRKKPYISEVTRKRRLEFAMKYKNKPMDFWKKSTRRVAGQVDRSECAVRNCWEQWTREGTHARKTGSGATRKTTRREDRRIVRQALVDPTVTRSTIRADIGVTIVPQTISRHLAEANLKSKRPCCALPLTPEHRQLHLQWCQARSMWNVTDWQKVVFSDESWFVLGTDDNRVRVWRCPGERYNSPHTVPRHTARTAGVMVWGAIAYDSR
ncbi:HTH_Tnp_Tc3_2 domain-containing protein [Trichonephila clavipes]|nr:HTH_Tnp_Tc3_2 domain-containing protein [Trichonephila clavipes]